ncbi:transcriptional regulator, TetR family [Nitrobacter hamburgensis X14]|uniref:Transcriptional regulator, TetR family n=1 Tax=Nitrobacter hamburgensis (strain DSM 10229 / NCIMB 13809 / X14) TaxID=323097 RepID=Q1QJX3_NITHX|nr:TetR family transcriptional regulator C-terminal domain-containing protein [Nitrobacter hamburgensis]ABE63474.1 transcriptional regulator, TetR family [Nitrobacter hamburgensis X14]
MNSRAKAAVRKRPGRVQRRKNLLDAVHAVISESGIDGASMRQIADRANVSTGTINYHFGNKHKLMMAALQASCLPPRECDSSADSPLAQLRVLVFSHAFRSSTDRFWHFWVNYTAAGTRDTEMRKHQNQRFERQQAAWTKLIESAINAGELPSCPDAEVVSEQLLIFIHGLAMRQIMQPGAESRLHCEKLLERYFETLERPRQS